MTFAYRYLSSFLKSRTPVKHSNCSKLSTTPLVDKASNVDMRHRLPAGTIGTSSHNGEHVLNLPCGDLLSAQAAEPNRQSYQLSETFVGIGKWSFYNLNHATS
jgi:hypothetical protein